MVASSRPSLRRPTMQGDHKTKQSDSPVVDQAPQIPTDPNLRPKRVRVPSLSGRDQLHKRRKVALRPEQEEIRIPLRGKTTVRDDALLAGITRALPRHPLVTQNTSSDNSPLGSPSTRPQYDQIKRIEEKARALIQGDSNASPKDDRRRLRSEHGSSRSKTELAQYFPTFDEMLSLDPPDPGKNMVLTTASLNTDCTDILTAKTRIILVDDTPEFVPSSPKLDPFGARKSLHNVDYLDLSAHISPVRHAVHDPLSPDVYYKAHRKAERHEKQMKNGDKERAQHEKYQLERLLDGLRGPDWLKTLGITGVTDTEKKRYEPKRALFIRETRALIDKFRRWKEEEKRRKLEKEQAQLEDAADADEDGDTGVAASTSTRKNRRRPNSRIQSPSVSATSSEKFPDSSELDALASQQLLQEAKSAIKRKKPSTSDLPIIGPELHKPFTSFYSKRHIRDAVVAGRQRGRTILAFGEPVPDLEEVDFELPESILTEDAIRSSQRNKRRARRSIHE